MTRRGLLLGAAALPLVACGPDRRIAPPDVIQAALWQNRGEPRLTLFTMVNNRTDIPDHAGLLIGSDHVAIYDPAGTWRYDPTPERLDLHYGMRPEYVALYISHHARSTYHVRADTLEVPMATARAAMASAEAQGATPKVFCARAIAEILNRTGYGIPVSFHPRTLRRNFMTLGPVTTERFYENDDTKNYERSAEIAERVLYPDRN